ncbi:MAG: hypothetical protein EA377_12005 [Phycisphaerales bacterium]|nr:MAG: hypothetical protein EA377_12005 [Phycisphaerales bacterium]
MRRLDLFLIVLGGVMLLLIAIFAMRITTHVPNSRMEMSRVKLMQLSPETREMLRNLEHEVLITYYVSGREHMPSHMRQLERQVVDFLSTLKREAGGQLDYQVIDPHDDPEMQQHAAQQRAAPFRVRTVTRDAYTETSVWSSLQIRYGPHSPAIINGVSPDHLPRLQQLLTGQIEQMKDPRQPVFGLAVEDGSFRQFRQFLQLYGEVVPVEVHGDRALPRELDALFWMNPGEVSSAQISRIRRFMESGRSVIVAGSRHDVQVQRVGGEQRFSLIQADQAPEELLAAFGLRPIDGLVLDHFSQTVPGDPAPRPVRFMIRCTARNQDFRAMRMIPNGNLLFSAATPFEFDRERLTELGYYPTVLATTSDRTQIQDMKYGEVDLLSAEMFSGDPTPRLPLMVWLRPNAPWQGSLVAAGASSLFDDRLLMEDGFAHRRLVETFAKTFGADDRLVINRTDLGRSEPLPTLAGPSRWIWRAVCIGAIPVILLGVAYRRGVLSIGRSPSPAGPERARALPLTAGAGLVAVLIISGLFVATGWRADLTANQTNVLASATRDYAQAARDEHAVNATLYISRQSSLPPELRPMVRRLRDQIRDLRRAGAQIDFSIVIADDLTDEERERLAEERRIKSFRFTTRDEDQTIVRTIYCTLELNGRERTERLSFTSRQSFEHLEFRLAFALWRLQTGREIHIAFASDIPRLSAAEAFHDFQQRNLLAPTGTDVYSQARSFLEAHDFRVSHIDARHPRMPEDPVDLIVWMQPRRDIMPMLEIVAEQLHRGTPVFLAGQHYNMQSRQYRGQDFEVVYWPQPQVLDIDLHLFPQLGLTVKRELVFDRLKFEMALDTQVNVAAGEREYQEQISARSFQVRASASSFDRFHPAMRGLGDQALPFPAFIEIDKEALRQHGLTATPLMTTSDQSWRFNWTGGWIPERVLNGPNGPDARADQREANAEANGQLNWSPRLPLAVWIEGTFPDLAESLEGRRHDATDPIELESDEHTDETIATSQLMLVATSHLFRNERFGHEDYRSDHFLLNGVSVLALPEALAEVATHRHMPRGVDLVTAEERLRWRSLVVFAGPVLLIGFGSFWWIARRKAPVHPDLRKSPAETNEQNDLEKR